MPVSALNALPSAVAKILDDRHVAPGLVSWLRTLLAARLPTVLATLLLTLFVYRWATIFMGPAPLWWRRSWPRFHPILLRTGLWPRPIFISPWELLCRYIIFDATCLQPTLRNACLSGFTLALAQLTKPFSLLLYGLVFCFLVFSLFFGRLQPDRSTLVTRKNIVSYFGIALCIRA